jgi:hypothetical protein
LHAHPDGQRIFFEFFHIACLRDCPGRIPGRFDIGGGARGHGAAQSWRFLLENESACRFFKALELKNWQPTRCTVSRGAGLPHALAVARWRCRSSDATQKS